MKIYLDDVRKAPIGWTRTYTANETIDMLDEYDVEEISLDHDLGDESINGTGYDVLVWLEEQVFCNNYKPPYIYIHTANPVAHMKMKMIADKINGIR